MLNIKFLRQRGLSCLKKRFFNNKKISSLPCFYCSVDSTELKLFLILTIGGLVLCSVLVGIGLWLKGRFRDNEKLSAYPLEVERGEAGRNKNG